MEQSRPKARTRVFRNAFLVTQDARPPGLGDLYVEDARIAAITPGDPPPAWSASPEESADLSGAWILPGFVQTHVHLCQTLFRGAAEQRTLYRWLAEVVWPFEAALDGGSLEASAEMGIRQLLSGGTTTLLDMGTTHDTEAVARAASRSGIRIFLGPAAMDQGPEPSHRLLQPPRAFLGEVETLASRWHGHDHGRLRLALCPRFVPSVSDALWREMAARADFAAFPIHTHGSETLEEVADVRGQTGLSPMAYYGSLPAEGSRFKIAHGVWLDEDDRRELSRMGASITHCPSSNLKLGSGLADIAALRKAGVSVGLGADGAACNNRLDAWSEMRAAAHIQAVVRGPESVDAREILRMATHGGAEVLGLGAETGMLRAGYSADLVVLRPTRDAGAWPGRFDDERPEDFLVYAGSAAMVEQTWVMGRRVHDETIAQEWRAEWEPRLLEARRVLAARGAPAG